MKDVLSISVRNNTGAIQPVTLFTDAQNIPSNLLFGITATFSYDLTGESFATNPVNIYVQVDTQPITSSTPFTTVAISPAPYNTTSVLNALNSLGFDTWVQSGDIITTTSTTYYWGLLRISPSYDILFDNITASYSGYFQLIENQTTLAQYPLNFPSNNLLYDRFLTGSQLSVNINKPNNSEGYVLVISYQPDYTSSLTTIYNSGNQYGSLNFSWVNNYAYGYYLINVIGLP